MDLILLRHGKAQDTHPMGDAARELTSKGHEQAKHQALRLKQLNLLPKIVLTSPYTRTQQTSDTFCQAAGIPGAVIQSWLACGMSPEDAIPELANYADFDCVAIVGHEPDLSQLIHHLLGITQGAVKMKKGSLACLKVNLPTHKAVLKFLSPPILD
jgi:phosphohistidine phosphatase